MFDSTNISSHPLNKIIFIKKICSFAAKVPVQGVELARCVNTTFSEALIEYFGFQEILRNIETSASISSRHDTSCCSSSVPPPKVVSELKSWQLRHFINKLSHFANTAKWIFIELFQSGFVSCDDAMTFILEGDNEDEIGECLKVLFRRLDADSDENESRRHQNPPRTSDFSREWNTTTSYLLSNTPIGRFKEVASKIENDKQKNEDAEVCQVAETFSSPRCCIENSSRPLFVAMKRNHAKVVKVLLENGQAEWDFLVGCETDEQSSKNNFDMADDSSHFYVKTCQNLSAECLQVLHEFVLNLENDDERSGETQRKKLDSLGVAGLLACLRAGHRLSLPCSSKQDIKIQQCLLAKTVQLLLTNNKSRNEEFPTDQHDFFFRLLDQSLLHLCTSNKFVSVEIMQSLLIFAENSRSKMLNYSYCVDDNDHVDENNDSSFLVCQEAKQYGLTPLLAAVCNKRKDIVEFLLSQPEVSVLKSLEQSKGGWICKMESEYTLWNHQFEEVMTWIVNDSEKQCQDAAMREESSQGETITKENEDDAWPQMSSGWTDDDDDHDETNQDEKNEKPVVQSQTYCNSSALSSPRQTTTHLTLETIISRHKSKLQDSIVIEILALLLKAKTKEECGH